MTPRDVDAMSNSEYRAFWRYAEKVTRDQEREARKARKGR